MARTAKMLILNGATVIAILLAGAVAFYSLDVLIRGMPGMSVEETIPGAPLGPSQLVYHPYPATRLPLLASLLLIGGLLGSLWKRRVLLVAWIGLALFVIFGGLLIFGIGLVLLLAAVPLLALLTIITFVPRNAR